VYAGGPPSQPVKNINNFSREPSSKLGMQLADTVKIRIFIHQIVKACDQCAHFGLAADDAVRC
jgi:hypothetical protein